MDALDEFPSQYWRATDLKGKQVKLTISGTDKRVMNDGTPKLVVSFKEDTRELVLNNGNRLELVARFGRDTGDWVGKPITLHTIRCQGPAGPTYGVRILDEGMTVASPDDTVPF